MPFHPTRVFVGLLFTAMASLVALADDTKAESSPKTSREAIRESLASYNATPTDKTIEEQATSPVFVPSSPKPARKPQPRVNPAVRTTKPAPIEVEDFVELPKVTVRELKPVDKPVKSLPRVDAPGVVKAVPEGDEYETKAARSERLIQKHFTKFEQALDRLIPRFGRPSLAAQADQKEHELVKARTINQIADAIELDEMVGADPERIRKLRHEYLRLYYAGPAK